MCKQATLTENEATFYTFNSFFPPLFRSDFWLRLLHQKYTAVPYIVSWYTQEPSGEVSHDVAVAVVVRDVGEVDE